MRNQVEDISKLQSIFAEKGINVQAIINNGRRVNNPLDISHCWIIEEDYIFSVRLFKNVERKIRKGTSSEGKINIAGGFYVWRILSDEETLNLINGLQNAVLL